MNTEALRVCQVPACTQTRRAATTNKAVLRAWRCSEEAAESRTKTHVRHPVGQAVREMSANEVILTFGWSATVFMFLREAAKKHDFQARHAVLYPSVPCRAVFMSHVQSTCGIQLQLPRVELQP